MIIFKKKAVPTAFFVASGRGNLALLLPVGYSFWLRYPDHHIPRFLSRLHITISVYKLLQLIIPVYHRFKGALCRQFPEVYNICPVDLRDREDHSFSFGSRCGQRQENIGAMLTQLGGNINSLRTK